MMLETFEIELGTDRFVIEPQENGTFRVMQGEEKLGVVYPEPGEDGADWKTMDELDAEFVKQLGEQISAQS